MVARQHMGILGVARQRRYNVVCCLATGYDIVCCLATDIYDNGLLSNGAIISLCSYGFECWKNLNYDMI